MKRPSRNIVALLLSLIYIMISLSPLAPLTLRSASQAHGVAGECSGNCDICGCSAERRASRTCCCWIKKLKHQHAKKKVPDCCSKKKSKTPILTSNCPCGSKGSPGLPGVEKTEVLPYRFNEGIVPLAVNSLLTSPEKSLTDRHVDPPDPPPKLDLFS
jgi:hypothetical protein